MGISKDDVIYVADLGNEMRVLRTETMMANAVNTKGSVFIVVLVAMMYAMSKIKTENPIDALKNENI